MKGLALEGGGVKGAYHIGVMTALREMGLADFDGYVGTSIGAINAAMFCAGDWEKTLELWDNINMQNVLDMDELSIKELMQGQFNAQLIGNALQLLRNLGMFVDTTADKMRAFLKQYIDEKAIRESNKDFGLVTYSVPDFAPHYMMKEDIPKGQIYDYVMASSAYPAFKWQKIEGKENKWFIDGGVYDNMPVKMLVDKGYDEIVAIRTNIKKYRAYRDVDLKGAKLLVFTPSEKLDYAVNFTKENIDRFKEMGYYEAKRTILGLPSFRFCVRAVDDQAFSDFMHGIDRKAIEEVVTLAKLKVHKSQDANIEDVIDTLRDMLKLSSKSSDLQVFENFLEVFAVYFNVDRFRFYDIDEFYDAVFSAAKKAAKGIKGGIDEVIKNDRGIKNELKEIFIAFYKCYHSPKRLNK